MSTTLYISNGTDTIDLNDGVNYGLLSGWIPRVAKRRASLAAGVSSHLDIAETIPIRVFGATAAAALDALADLAAACDNIQRWRAGDNVDPWVLYYAPNGSSLSQPLSALLVDAAPAGDLIGLAANFNETIRAYEINPVTLTLTRRGLWLTEETTKTAAAANNPAVLTVDFVDALPIAGPTKVVLTDIEADTELIGSGYLLFTDISPQSANGYNFKLYDAGDMTGANFASTADTTNKAFDGNVMRIDASSNTTGTLTISEVNAGVNRLYIFAAVRNNNATAWRIRARSVGYSENTGQWFDIDTSSTSPRWLAIGMVGALTPNHVDILIDVATDGSTGTLDIAGIVILPDGANSRIIEIIGADYDDNSYERAIAVDPRALTHDDPLFGVETAIT